MPLPGSGRLIKALGTLFGVNVIVSSGKPLQVFDPDMMSIYFNNDEIVRRYERSMAATGMEWADNLAKRCRYISLVQTIELVMDRAVTGDFVECGCWRGHSAHITAGILAERKFAGTFHIFDSFDGLSDLEQADTNEREALSPEEVEAQAKMFACSEEEFKKNLAEFSFIKTYKGWIPERFEEVSNKTFSFVHIDVDLYQPYIDSIDFFYPRLSSGGVMVFDDYGYTQFPGSTKAVDQRVDMYKPSFFYQIPTGGAFLIK